MLWDSKNCWKAFSVQKVVKVLWSGGGRLAKDQVNMVDETKLHSPVCSIFEALVVGCTVGHCCGGELGPLCWSLLAEVLQLWCIIDLPRSHYLLRHVTSVPLRCTGFARIQKALVDQTGSRPPNSDHDLCGASSASGSVHGSCFSVQPELVISSGHKQSTSFHRTSQSNQEMVRCYCVE